MEKLLTYQTPLQIEASWQSRATAILQPIPEKPITHPKFNRIKQRIAGSKIGKLQQTMSKPSTGINWLIEQVNGPIENRLTSFATHPKDLSERVEKTVVTELSRTARHIEHRPLTKAAEAFPWIVAGAGFVPIVGIGITMLANLTNATRAAVGEHNMRKAALYLLFVPLNPALGTLSLIPGIGWAFFAPAVLTNSIFLEEMGQKYKIALTEGELALAQEIDGTQTAKAIQRAVTRFEIQQEKKQQRRKHGITTVKAQDVLQQQLDETAAAENTASKQKATGKNKRRLLRAYKRSENTKTVLDLLQKYSS